MTERVVEIFKFELPVPIVEGDIAPERVIKYCRWELMEWHHEFYPHNWFGWYEDIVIHLIPVIAQPDEEEEVLGKIREG